MKQTDAISASLPGGYWKGGNEIRAVPSLFTFFSFFSLCPSRLHRRQRTGPRNFREINARQCRAEAAMLTLFSDLLHAGQPAAFVRPLLCERG